MRASFQKLWENYPSDSAPCRDPKNVRFGAFANQCAIRVGMSLSWAGGLNLRTFRGARCWYKGHNGHILRAQELANWLGGQPGGPIKYTVVKYGDKPKPGEKALEEVTGKTGIVFCRDFWGQGDAGDHIDLWNGSEMRTGSASYFLKSREVWFWKLD